MDNYKLWIRNGLEQANLDDSWHLDERAKARGSQLTGIVLLAGLLAFVGIVLLSRG